MRKPELPEDVRTRTRGRDDLRLHKPPYWPDVHELAAPRLLDRALSRLQVLLGVTAGFPGIQTGFREAKPDPRPSDLRR